MANSVNAIHVEEIWKSFGTVTALRDIHFNVEHGMIFGMIGPDGAGKTTLFRLIASLFVPDKGTIKVNGYDSVKDYRAIRRITGYMPGRFSLYQDLTVEENLKFFATIFGTSVKENYSLIKEIYSHIEPFKKRRAGNLSGGMKQKLALSCALIHRPKLLILDEPTTGIDAVSRREFWDMLSSLRNEGITIIISTPYMDEALRCDKIALINKGEILRCDVPEAITKSFSKPLYAVRARNNYMVLKYVRESGMAETIYPFGQFHHLIPLASSFSLDGLKDYLLQRGIEDFEIKPVEADIEDFFIDTMKTQEGVAGGN